MLESMLRIQKKLNGEGRHSEYKVAETCAAGKKGRGSALTRSFLREARDVLGGASRAGIALLRSELIYPRLLAQLENSSSN
jgi:hypothetical protein